MSIVIVETLVDYLLTPEKPTEIKLTANRSLMLIADR